MNRYPPAHAAGSSANTAHAVDEDHPRGADGEGSDDLEIPEDPHLALTSQTLNPDGTPKRPMNAFMIFARKRRPQISAANQMMRTGDISKILSKEWNAMEMSEKKFYLDQAKKLKDNFNNKYPDYVYRRRPNNSRKKRKPDQDPQSPTDQSAGGDTDDASLDDTSPVDMDDSGRDSSSAPYLYRPTSGSGSMYDNGDAFLPTHANSSYNYVPDFHSAQYGQGTRLPSVPQHEEPISHNALTPLRIPSLAETVANAQGLPYTSSRHSSQATITSPGQSAHSPQAYWDARHARSDASRSSASTWPVLPALDTVTIPPQRSGQSGQMSPQVPHRPWSSSASSATSSSSGGASGSHYGSSPFPTLTSPFYPAQSPSQRTADTVSSSPSSHPGNSPEYFSRPSYATTPSNSVPQPGGSGYLHNASQWAPQYPRSGNEAQQRSLPALQPITTYSLSSNNSASPPPSSSGTQSSHMAYWERSRYEGR